MLGRYALLVLAATVVVFPIYVAVAVAIQPSYRLLDFPAVLFPSEVDFGVFERAFTQARLSRYLLNSAIVSLAITFGQVITSILAAYAFAFLRFPAKNAIFVAFLATLMVPTEVTIVANFETVQRLGWLDSYQGLTSRSSRRPSAPSSSARRSCRCHKICATPPPSTDTDTGGSCSALPRRSPGP
jgi:sn-glycerol 3-phosphate transport system permease protein